MNAARRRARVFALQALYAVDTAGPPTGPDGGVILAGLWASRLDGTEAEEEPATPEEMDFARALVLGVMAQRDELDARVEAASQNWRLIRMPMVDRNILRLGAYELVHHADIPVSVSINEAIELAKRYGGAESRAFVNGILDRIAGEVGRGGRRGRA
jgi:N utilization substance protein B